jgi:hypothetical protein
MGTGSGSLRKTSGIYRRTATASATATATASATATATSFTPTSPDLRNIENAIEGGCRPGKHHLMYLTGVSKKRYWSIEKTILEYRKYDTGVSKYDIYTKYSTKGRTGFTNWTRHIFLSMSFTFAYVIERNVHEKKDGRCRYIHPITARIRPTVTIANIKLSTLSVCRRDFYRPGVFFLARRRPRGLAYSGVVSYSACICASVCTDWNLLCNNSQRV